jgi:hypothetical protein
MSETREFLGGELRRLALRAIVAQYDDINLTFFQGVMRRPVFALSESRARLGQWDPKGRRLELSEHLLSDHAWGTLVEVLKHEMAHQYVWEHLKEHEESAHGATFQRVCQDRGFDARAAGVAQPEEEDPSQQALLSKVARLLALAESPNEHEAQAAMNAAQRLMLKYNLEVVAGAEPADYVYQHLGTPTGRVNESQRILAAILSSHFFVETIWVPVWRVQDGKRGSVIEVCGTRANVAMAEYVHSFLMHTAERLWVEHKKRAKIRKNRDRLAYLAGVMTGFSEKLEAEKHHQASAGLVWCGDPGVSQFLRSRHPYIRHASYTTTSHRDAHQSGRAAGARIVLRRGVESGPSRGPKLLTR